MAHELSIRADGRAEMAFTGGETPWHGLGQPVTKGASIGVWLKEAGMDWEAKEASVNYRAVVPNNTKFSDMLIEVPSHKVLYRSDTCAPLGIVGQGYNVVQPREVLEFFRGMTEQGGWHIHTAGVLREGRKLWAMATNGEVEAVRGKKGDRVINQLLFATSLDGSMKTVVKECATVVVCANTMASALREGGKGVVVSHRSVFDERAVRRALDLSQDEFARFMAQARELADTPVDLSEAMDILRGVFGVRAKPAKPKVDTSWMAADLADYDSTEVDAEEDEKVARSVGRVLELYDGVALGAGNAGRRGTKWGLFNAVTQYVDHEMGRTPDTRMESAWFGRGETYKQAALEALTGAEA